MAIKGGSGQYGTVGRRSSELARDSDDDIVEAVLRTSRAMVSLAEASVRQVSDDITFAQYRTLLALALSGPCRLGALAQAIGVNPSTTTRMCDRLVRKELITRSRHQLDRRETDLALTKLGRALVADVTESRRTIVRSMLVYVPNPERQAMVDALTCLCDAVDGTPWARL